MHVRRRFWLEAILAITGGMLTIVSIVWPGRIDELPGFGPVRQNGAADVVTTVVFAVVAVELTVMAWAEWRRARAALPRA